jgi:hypothetical protein
VNDGQSVSGTRTSTAVPRPGSEEMSNRPPSSHYGHDYRNVDHHEERHQGGEGNEVYHHRQDTRKSSESLPHHQRERRGSWGQAPLSADEVFGVDLHVRGLPAQAPNARLVHHSFLLVALFVHTVSAFRAGLEVDGASFHRQRRLTEGLRKRRVSMHENRSSYFSNRF